MYALFASVFSIGKMTLMYCSPFFLTGVRMLIAGFILLLFQWTKHRDQCTVRREHWPLLFLIGLFNVFITNAFEFWGLQYMESAKTCLIYSLSPFVSIFLSYVILSETMSLKKWIGLMIGLLGFLPICMTGNDRAPPGGLLTRVTLPEVAVAISACTAVIGWIFMKKLTRQHHYPIIMANAVSFVIGGLTSLSVSAFTESWTPFPMTKFYPFLAGVLYIAIIHNVICYNLYAYSLGRFSVTFMTFAGISNPLFAAIFGWMFLHEKPGVPFFSSLFLVFFGLYLFSREETATPRLSIS